MKDFQKILSDWFILDIEILIIDIASVGETFLT